MGTKKTVKRSTVRKEKATRNRRAGSPVTRLKRVRGNGIHDAKADKVLKEFKKTLKKTSIEGVPDQKLKEVAAAGVAKTPKKRSAKVDTSLLSGTFEKRLPVKLTVEEISSKYARTTEIHQLIRVQEAKAREATKDMRDEIKKLKGEEDDLQNQLACGAEERPVTCRNKKDFRNDLVHTVREDLDEVVESRPMHMSERQENFPGTELPPGGRSAVKKARAARALAAVPDVAVKDENRTCTCGDVEDEHGNDEKHPGSSACNIDGCECVAFEHDPEKSVAMQKADDRVKELEAGHEEEHRADA